MKCVDCQDLLAEYALDSLGPREKEQVAEHLADGCTDCQQHLDAMRESWSAVALALEPVPPPNELKTDILSRLRTQSEPSKASRWPALSPEPEPIIISQGGWSSEGTRRWKSVLTYLAAALCGIAVGFWFARDWGIESTLVDRYHSQLQQAERTFGAPQMRFAALQVSGNQPQVRGYLIWDSVASELHVYAFELGAPPAGSVYRLWLVADGDKWVPVGDLKIGPDGVCSAVLRLPKLASPASGVVVTTEPTGGTTTETQPHGPIGLQGEFL
jgi:anti-sigma-K factor RskA